MKRTHSFQITSSHRVSLCSLLAAIVLSANLAFADNCVSGVVVARSESTAGDISPSEAGFIPVTAKKVSAAHCNAHKGHETSMRVRNTVPDPAAKSRPNKAMPMQVNPENIQADLQN